MKISHGRYYYPFHELVEKLRREDNTCFICGSPGKVGPHHITRVKESDRRYALKSNVVLLCPRCHNKFHKLYGSGKGVNQENFNTYVKKEHRLMINKLEREISELEAEKEKINHTILVAVKNERTALGSSVLRQLAESLGVMIE